MAAPPCTLRAAWLLVPPLPVRPQGLPSRPPPVNLNQTVQVVSVFVPPLRSGTKPLVRDLPPTRIVRDCQTTADAAYPHPPSPGSLQKKAEREAGREARSGTCSKGKGPSATSHDSQKRIARAWVRRSVTRSASQRVGGSLDIGPACSALVYRSRMI